MTRKEQLELSKMKKELLLDLGQRIKQLREQKGFSQVDLAARIKGRFDTTNISRIETGRSNPTIYTLARLADALEIELTVLFK